MATLSLTLKTQYKLQATDRLKITSKSDNPSGVLLRHALIGIEQQRIAHVKKFGHPFG